MCSGGRTRLACWQMPQNQRGWLSAYGVSFVPLDPPLAEDTGRAAGRSHGRRSRPAPRTALGRVKPKALPVSSVSGGQGEQEKPRCGQPSLDQRLFANKPRSDISPGGRHRPLRSSPKQKRLPLLGDSPEGPGTEIGPNISLSIYQPG